MHDDRQTYENLPVYRGYIVRHPAPPSMAIDPRPFMFDRLRWPDWDAPTLEDSPAPPRRGYANSEARKRIENQPEHPCYAVTPSDWLPEIQQALGLRPQNEHAPL